jgi:hypothetical protein
MRSAFAPCGTRLARVPLNNRRFRPKGAPGAYIMSELGKFLVVLGTVIAVAGLLLWSRLGRSWIGRLRGDIHFRRGNLLISFPLVTCLLISIVLSLLAWLFGGRR